MNFLFTNGKRYLLLHSVRFFVSNNIVKVSFQLMNQNIQIIWNVSEIYLFNINLLKS